MNKSDLSLALHTDLFPPESRILVSVSGGPDSVALIHALCMLNVMHERSWSLRMLHVNHGLRGDEASRDESFVLGLGEELALSVDLVKVDTKGFADQSRMSIETAARKLRYDALYRALQDWPGDLIATGHTMDDQAETVVLNLLRGAGLRGLGAMSDRKGIIVRPMLSLTRGQVLEFLRRNGFSYCEDSSNNDQRYRRNLIRHTVLPTLEAIQPAATSVLARAASDVRVDSEFIQSTLRSLIAAAEVQSSGEVTSFQSSVWRALHPSLRRHFMHHVLELVCGPNKEISHHHVDTSSQWLYDQRENGRMPGLLPRGVSLRVTDGICFVGRANRSVSLLGEGALPIPGSYSLPGGRITAQYVQISDPRLLDQLVSVCGPLHALCDAGSFDHDNVKVRSWRPGDRLLPMGMSGSKKIQDLLVDRRVPAEVKGLVPVVLAQHPIWIVGLALDRRVSLRPESRNAVHFRFDPEPESAMIEFLEQFGPQF